MTTRIISQDFHFEDTSNSIRVKTDVDKALIDSKLLIPQCRHFNLAAGTIITVQVLDKDRDVLFHEAEFRVTRAVETRRQVIDEQGERTAIVIDYAVQQWTDWRSTNEAPVIPEPELARVTEQFIPGEGTLKWNPGKQSYEVIVASEVWTTVERIKGEGKDEYKARALSIAAGSLPKAA